ncbi:S24 family peptidase [Acidiphilium sp. C61]|uniref:S24 family peptidase n=1 Tax=Acidiphilium sp. C61 TaxID=1671485 RepID=UPI0035302D42
MTDAAQAAMTDAAQAAIADAAQAAIADAAQAAMIPDEPPAEARPATPDDAPPETLAEPDGVQPGTVWRAVPVIGLGAADDESFDDEGYPSGTGWRRLERVIAEAGIVDDPHLFALVVEDDSLEPVCRRGHVVIVSPDAPVRMGDLVVARLAPGGLVAGRLLRRTISRIDLAALTPAAAPRALPAEAVVALQRIVWISQ